MDKEIEKQLIIELEKFLKFKKHYNTIEEIQKESHLNDETFYFLKETILNRIDPIDWIKNKVKTFHPKLGSIPFKLYEFQEDIIKLFLSKHFIITLKSRQVGMSTLTQALCLWLSLNYQKYNILIISTDQKNAVEFLDKIKGMYNSLEDNQFKLPLETNNKQQLVFSNGSQIRAMPATDKAARGSSINFFVIDEAAFIENIDKIYQGAYPTISRAFPTASEDNKKPYGIFIISTPDGISGTGEWYYDMYTGALMKNNKYIPVRIHWSLIPEFDDTWYLDQCSQMNWDHRKIASELELSFVASGDTFVPSAILDSIGTTNPKVKDINERLWVWEDPIKDEKYVIGVDVAYGDKKDSSVVEILKASTLEQVAEFESNSIIIDDFADVVLKLMLMYNNALTNIERNAVGKVLIEKILKRTGGGCGINLYKDVNPGDLIKKSGNISNADRSNSKLGTTVTGTNRPVLLSIMYNTLLDKYTESLDSIIADDGDSKQARAKFEAIMNNKKASKIIKKNGIVKSERLLNQLLGFVNDSHGRPSGKHDDIVMSWSHAIYCYTKCKNRLIKGLTDATFKDMGYDKKREERLNTIKFMQQNSSNSIWKQYDANTIADMFEEENLEKKEEENQNNNEINNESNNSSTLTDIYKYMYL